MIELLVVVAVISILATLTVMSISSPGGAARLTTAGNETVDILNNARQYAQAQNALARVAVVFSGTDAGRVIGTFASTDGTTWTQIDRWRTLPPHAQMDLPNSTNAFPASPLLALQRAGGSVNCAYMEFLPDGRPNTTNVPVAMLRTVNGPTNNFYKIIINQATGTPIVRRP